MSANNQLATQQSAPPTFFNPFDREQAAIMKEVCTELANSDLVPERYRISDKNTEKKAVANCMIAVGMALRMQADPLMVMQNLVVIHGTPSWSSKFLIGTVNTCGRYSHLNYREVNLGKIGVIKKPVTTWKLKPGTADKMKVVEMVEDASYKDLDNYEMVAFATDKATGEVLESSPVTMLMAILEGWYDKDGSKWKTMRAKMMRYRSASFWTNEHAPEISMGMRTIEEAEDITIDTTYTDVTDVPKMVSTTIQQDGNKTDFDFSAAKPVEGSQPDPVKPEETVKEDPKQEEKPMDTLAKVGAENAAKELKDEKPPVKKTADAGVTPTFGFDVEK